VAEGGAPGWTSRRPLTQADAMPVFNVVESRRARQHFREWRRQALRTLGLLLGVIGACTLGLALLDQSGEPFYRKAFDALWNSANLITTLGDFSDFDRRQKIFMLLGMLITVVIAGWAISKLTGLLTSDEVAAHRERKHMQPILDKLANHVVVIGFAELGVLVAARLKEAGDRVVVIERNKDLADSASSLGYLVVLGDAGAQDDVLESARVGTARAVVLTSEDPDRNLALTLMAHSLNPKLRIAATGKNSHRGALLHRAGASEVVIADDLIAGALVGRLGSEGSKAH
jgi:voltage-gated potassium channel